MNLKQIMCDNLLLIVPNNQKEEIIKEISLLENLYSYKIVSDLELKKSLFFDYDLKTISFVMKEKQVNYQIAKEYIESMYYLTNKTYKSNKLNELNKLKEKLISLNLLYFNNKNKQMFLNKKTVVYGFDVISKEQKLIFSNLNDYQIIYKENAVQQVNNVYVFETLEKEVDALCFEISELVHKGVDINKIKIANINEDYIFTLKRYFKMYNLPLTLENNTSLFSLRIVKDFYNEVLKTQSLKQALEYFKEKYSQHDDIYKKLLNVCNNLIEFDFEDIKIILKEQLVSSKEKTKIYDNSIQVVSLDNLSIKEDEHLFVLSINQGIYPVSYKNDEFLNDEEKQEIEIDTSFDKNNLSKEKFKILLTKSNNIFLSYKRKSAFASFKIAFILKELGFNEINYQEAYLKSYSLLKDKLKLAKIYDKVYYSIQDISVRTLAGNYNIDYKTYDHKFKKFDGQKIVSYMENKQKNLSYSTIDDYFKCGFKYYLKYLLNLNENKMQIGSEIGNVFHKVLELSSKEDFDFETSFNNCVKEIEDKTIRFYIKKLKRVLADIIRINKENFNDSQLDKTLNELKVQVEFEKPIKTKFKGFIDKLYYTNINNKDYVAILDYKTGNPDIDLSKTEHGLSLQLPSYLYLLKHSDAFANAECCGFYLQKIIPGTIPFEKGYEKALKERLLLEGYSNDSFATLSILDPHFSKSTLIKTMSLTKAGKFNANSKVLSTKQMDELAALVEEKIKEALREISECNFDISPKIFKSNNQSCKYCEFNECCYKKFDDNIYLDQSQIDEATEEAGEYYEV